jgi:poly-gamma-glutamate capsule biosynthesis protein CapA/YwtB (metallophosphatase superfamily)
MALSIALCGDIMLGADVGESMAKSTAEDWLSDVAQAWRDADLVIGNLESPCVESGQPVTSAHPELIFHSPAHRLSELGRAGFSALTLANNHILNCGEVGLRETLEGLDEAGIYHTGAGRNLAEAMQPAFIPIRGLIVGLVAFCYSPPAGKSSPGVAPCEPP